MNAKCTPQCSVRALTRAHRVCNLANLTSVIIRWNSTTAGQNAFTQNADSGISNDDSKGKLYPMPSLGTWKGEDVNSRLDLTAHGCLLFVYHITDANLSQA
jgi:hypothetical protein